MLTKRWQIADLRLDDNWCLIHIRVGISETAVEQTDSWMVHLRRDDGEDDKGKTGGRRAYQIWWRSWPISCLRLFPHNSRTRQLLPVSVWLAG